MSTPEFNDIPGIIRFLKWIKDRLWNYTINEGCFKIQLINKTGTESIYGEIVEASTTTDLAFEQGHVNDSQPIGIVAEGGIADGLPCWIAVQGVAEVLLKDGTISTHSYWVRTSDVVGRADATLPVPPGGGIPELDQHMQEIGHCLESKSSGTAVLAKIILHFN